MTDSLEKFIWEGEAREVDAWFQKEGFGITPCMCPQAPGGYGPDDGHCLRCGEVGPAPRYMTRRVLRDAILDRIRSAGETKLKIYAEQLFAEVTGEDIPALVQAWRFSELLDAENRQVILAAARTLGLHYGT